MDQRADGRLAIAGALLCLATGLIDSVLSAGLAVTLLVAAGAWHVVRHHPRSHPGGAG